MKRKIYSVLYVAIFALLMSGCNMSGVTDGCRSAVKGNAVADEENTESEQDTTVATGKNKGAEKNLATENFADLDKTPEEKIDLAVGVADIPEYSGKAYCEVNGNVPYFSEDELVTEAFENYSELDSLGRCGVAYANICKELMPTKERGEIGMVKPSGWHTVKYSDRIDGNYLYNRCHLIAYQLAGENANEKNLITGTRYLNVTGMLPFENEVADYVENTGNHVLYRVTPVFDGDNLVASGVLMEAESVEDKGAGVYFNVYVYNVQPGVVIDYATGDSEADPGYVAAVDETDAKGRDEEQDGDQAAEVVTSEEIQATESDTGNEKSEIRSDAANEETYIVNTNTGKFHKPSCRSVKQMKE